MVDLLFGLITLAMGVGAGWWLRSRGGAGPSAPAQNEEVRRAREVLACLQKMASHVATEIGEHSTRVEEINEELASAGGQESTQIVHVVAKLVDANKSMQGRLDQAEDRLREQARLVESQAVQARTDALTLVGNRRAFDDEMTRHWTQFRSAGQPFILAMIDLDRFKKVNDTGGHQAGDEILRGVGRVMRRTLRETDLVARYGGEEFAVLFSNTSADEAREVLTRLRKAIARAAFDFQGKSLCITASIGTAESLADTPDAADVIKRADEALYASKSAGRNCAHWHDGREVAPFGLPAAPAAAAPKAPSAPPAPSRVEPAPAKPASDACEVDPLQTEMSLGLTNRTAFCQHVRSRVAEWNRGGPAFSLVLVAIDQYQQTKHHYGQRAGEEAVALLAKVSRDAVREMDLPARYNPSCLALLLPTAKLPDATRVAQRIREAVAEQSVSVGSTQLKFTVSIGVIEIGSKDDMVSLLRRAEAALDAGHTHGGNCIYHHDGDRCVPAATLLVGVSTLG